MAIEVSVVGFDIAKNVFQIHGVDRRERQFSESGCDERKYLSSSDN